MVRLRTSEITVRYPAIGLNLHITIS